MYDDSAVRGAVRAAIDRARVAVEMLEPDSSWLKLTRQYDPARAIGGLATKERIDGVELEVTRELDKRQQRTSTNSCYVPWSCLAYQNRADVVGTSSAGGYLVETVNFATEAQALMSLLVLGRLGATALDTSTPINLPKISGSATYTWLSQETTQIAESDQQLGQVAFSPHTVGAYTEMSRLLVKQSTPGAAGVVARNLTRLIKRAIEAAAFAGPGNAGQPHGLIGLTGVNAVSGATFALATAMTAVGDTGDALEDDMAPGWVAAKSVAIALRQRQELTNSSLTLWRGPVTFGTLCDTPAGATSGLSSGDAIFGMWRYLVLLSWGGLEVSVNPFGNSSSTPPYAPQFQAGIVGLRCMATLDVAPVWPGAFSVVTGIT